MQLAAAECKKQFSYQFLPTWSISLNSTAWAGRFIFPAGFQIIRSPNYSSFQFNLIAFGSFRKVLVSMGALRSCWQVRPLRRNSMNIIHNIQSSSNFENNKVAGVRNSKPMRQVSRCFHLTIGDHKDFSFGERHWWVNWWIYDEILLIIHYQATFMVVSRMCAVHHWLRRFLEKPLLRRL